MTDLDHLFDDQLPKRIRIKAAVHFTPIEVAQLAARMLAPRAGTRVLDVGSGAGKFCIVAAMEMRSSTFVGVEQRPHLVRLANRLVKSAELDNVTFIEGDAFDLDWSRFDAFYFFNPFAEQRNRPAMRIDATIAFAPETFDRYVERSFARLENARFGTRVVTYHGMGGDMPQGYQRFSEHRAGTDWLELWIKTVHP